MSAPASTPLFHKWHRVVLSLCFIVFAGELAYCLIVMPWMSNWQTSYIPMHNPKLASLWMSPYFRGVFSGLGLLNLYVALAEIGRLLRFNSKTATPPQSKLP